MDYIEVYIRVKPVDPWSDILIAGLAEIGFESFSEEAYGLRAYIPEPAFNEASVRSFFEDYTVGGRETSPESLSFQVSRMGGKNWNAVWESNFSPVEIAGRCLVRAPFHEKPADIDYDIVIEPKMSFGTGHHETTVLVAEWLMDTDVKEKKVLDMGCGTGVLAILAAKMGASSVTAVDNYLYAWENTVENAERNGIKNIQALHGDATLLGDEQFDMILANITRNVLLEDMGTYCSVLSEGGSIFLSGFLLSDKEIIQGEAAKQGLRMAGSRQKGDWLSLKFIK